MLSFFLCSKPRPVIVKCDGCAYDVDVAVAKRKSGRVGLFIKNNIWPFIENLRQFE